MKEKRIPSRRKAYQAPRLIRYGDLYKLTGAKGGTKGDGGGKPSTKSSGANA